MSVEKPREIAVRILRRNATESGFIEDFLDDELSGRVGAPPPTALEPVDRRLVQELVFGIVRWQGTLDWLIRRKTEGRTQKQLLNILLRLGLYQIFWLERIPEHAAVHETVELAKQLGFGPQAGFINAVLRGYLRERETTVQELARLKHEQPDIGYSHPKWLYERWRARWSDDEVRSLMEWNNQPPPTYARLNSLKTSDEALARQWESEGVLFTPRGCGRVAAPPPTASLLDENGRRRSDDPTGGWDWVRENLVFELRSHPSLASLPSFQQGLFYVQDPSTLLAVRELDPKPGEAILDACAAPGGKTTYIAQLMENRGYIMAQDIDVRRRQMVRDNCDRLGIRIVNLSRATSDVNPDLSEPFDRVLVDVPCSNTGVMRRRVDLRWRIAPAEVARLTSMQLQILSRAAEQVKPGGVLVYSTCSLEPEENTGVIQKFLDQHKAYRVDRERTLLPFKDAVDGAYVARLIRDSQPK